VTKNLYVGWDAEAFLLPLAHRGSELSVFLPYSRNELQSLPNIHDVKFLSVSRDLNWYTSVLYSHGLSALGSALAADEHLDLGPACNLRWEQLENCFLQFTRVASSVPSIWEFFELNRILISHFRYLLLKANVGKLVFRIAPHLYIDYVVFLAGFSLDIPACLFQPLRGFTRRLKPIHDDRAVAFYQVYDLYTNKRLEFSTPSQTKPMVASRLYDSCQQTLQRLTSNIPTSSQSKNEYHQQVYKEYVDQKRHNLPLLYEPQYLRVIQNLADLKREYEACSSDFSASESKNFLFFPLHMQPEASTLPMAGTYWSQFEACTSLALTLKKHGLFLFVKEHPHLFRWDFVTCRHFLHYQQFPRFKGFYYSLLKRHSNIVFLPIMFDADMCIAHKNCVGVYTVEGTSGLTSIVAGKDTYYSGEPWYSFHPRCFSIKSLNERLSEPSRYSGHFLNEDELRILADQASRHIYTVCLNPSNTQESKMRHDFLVDNC